MFILNNNNSFHLRYKGLQENVAYQISPLYHLSKIDEGSKQKPTNSNNKKQARHFTKSCIFKFIRELRTEENLMNWNPE